MTARFSGKATPEGTARYARRFSDAAPGHFRAALGVTIGSVGMGTYLGPPDPAADESYAQAAVDAVSGGCNVIDTASNYRFQRSERSIGEGLRRLDAKGIRRDELLLCTKGGFIPFDGDVPAHPPTYFTETFIKPGIAGPRDLVGGMHCMTPKYLIHQIECSRANLGVEQIDVYYVHNPETQLSAVETEEFYGRMREVFDALERAASDGKIVWYGCATWNAFRAPPGAPDHVSLERLVRLARDVAGESHRFRVIQLPYNLMMPEALSEPTQEVAGGRCTALEAAKRLGVSVFTSVPIFQGRLAYGLPKELKDSIPGLATDAQRAIQFVRSTPGVSAPLVGMSSPEHVKENLSLLKTPPLAPDRFAALLA
ncbi:MAG: hypothetical protein A3G34_15355 [Candidatus Lindowbacteria bacterium RIFCSPLOWO2_12_FULL_62_27]|nr:MAG: hypothetical protein A3G34_15355 [Candidatus Lindowbacteria bacterium RIFCSPLOWO2_12_FULL_62_27]OGH63911.1 MAG: hypothetical protein A3I06_05055 [Candidatus Lindowbacteria bacterium RIFCSPLOWO2_02_FULL_62_12]